MKNFLATLGLFLLSAGVAQAQSSEIYAYAGGPYSYLGGSYVYIGESFGLGLTVALNEHSFSINHGDAVTMKDGEINDTQNAYRYNDSFKYDRGFLTGRLYLKLSGTLASQSTWAYAGIGPGWSRYYFGYDRSGTSETVYVRDENLSVNNTEFEIGLAAIFDGIYLAVGAAAVNAHAATQLTWGIGFMM